MKRIAVFLSQTQVERLRAAAHIVGISMSELLRRFLDEALARFEKKS